MPMNGKKIEREVQKHILGFLDSGFSLLPGKRAKYSSTDHLNVLLKTAFEHRYIQGTARRLRSNWELPLPSGWTARRLLGNKDAGCLEREMQSVNSAVLDRARGMGLFRRQVICAIDSSDTEYYGWKDMLVVGGKQKNGTNDFHRISTTVPVSGGIKFDIGMVMRKPMDSDTEAIRSLIDSSSAYVDAWLYLLDRGFRSTENWKLFDDMGKRYLMPYPLDDRIEREIDSTGGLSMRILYGYEVKGRTCTWRTNILIIDSESVDGKKSKDGRQHFLLYATNMDVTPENAVHIAQLYERRFGIESEYRTEKHAFTGKTTSRNHSIILFFLLLSVILRNMWLLWQWLIAMRNGWKKAADIPAADFGDLFWKEALFQMLPT